MKTLKLLLFLGLITTSTSAQEPLDCNFNFNAALTYLKGGENVKRDSLRSIQYLKPCLRLGDANAQLLMGRLYAAKGDKESYKKAFKLYRKSAKQGNAMAMADLGVFFKYGKGCAVNLNKAKKWFRKSAKLGNDKGAYSLGYLYLKGYGGLTQDYSKAVKWFKKSNHSMAKYWLGVCYYYGYGVTKNIEKANELLDSSFSNTASNAQTKSIEISDEVSLTPEGLKSTTQASLVEQKITEELLLGSWSGSLLKYDWSGIYIENNYPIHISFNKDTTTNTLFYSIDILNQKLVSPLFLNDNAVYFENTGIVLPHISFDERIPNSLFYELMHTDLSIKKSKKALFLTGTISSTINNWNEAGAPLQLVLKKATNYSAGKEELRDEPQQVSGQVSGVQENNLIKTYPNPFLKDITVSYMLEQPSLVEIKITGINNAKTSIIKNRETQKKGSYQYLYDGSHLDKGVYVITIIINNQRKTKVIVKN